MDKVSYAKIQQKKTGTTQGTTRTPTLKPNKSNSLGQIKKQF